ncbi:nuclear transport factor 2 family protein [Variovorax dokdonensis]|uniref:Nuclear transport factor 2 family protein n=1 Tax=Variovorax dokdonensis TaxID=344883 RepID=A0ABT7NC16_9BURK|nr:nuclear transport factor 2 family protein [Variovorax dokdonensis]MDM0045477.1 nuclear transport factor 2 family protein [Variovorax dokdonensis]
MNTVNAADAMDVANDYIALWNETDPQRRLALLAQSWTDDARYVDPLAQASGREGISTLIGAVQARFPGFRFRLLGQPDSHGEHLRFSWELGPQHAGDMIQGTDFAQLSDGRLRSVTGFLDKVPEGA